MAVCARLVKQRLRPYDAIVRSALPGMAAVSARPLWELSDSWRQPSAAAGSGLLPARAAGSCEALAGEGLKCSHVFQLTESIWGESLSSPKNITDTHSLVCACNTEGSHCTVSKTDMEMQCLFTGKCRLGGSHATRKSQMVLGAVHAKVQKCGCVASGGHAAACSALMAAASRTHKAAGMHTLAPVPCCLLKRKKTGLDRKAKKGYAPGGPCCNFVTTAQQEQWSWFLIWIGRVHIRCWNLQGSASCQRRNRQHRALPAGASG